MTTAGLVAVILKYRYPILFPLAIIEGPILAMICGFLVHQGLMSIVPTFIVFYSADLVGDVGWYWVGRTWGEGFIVRFGKYVSITQESVDTVKRVFHRYHTPILLFSKVTMGLGFPGATLFTAGLSRISFYRYLILNAFGQLFWTGFLLTIGYTLGGLSEQISGDLGLAASAALILIVFAILFGFARFVRGALIKNLV